MSGFFYPVASACVLHLSFPPCRMNPSRTHASSKASTWTLPPVDFLRIDAKTGAVLIDVHVMPNAPQTRADGLHGEAGQQALKVRLHALPVEGQANNALVKWVAQQLGLPQRSVSLARGATARRKQLCVDADAAAHADWTALWPAS